MEKSFFSTSNSPKPGSRGEGYGARFIGLRDSGPGVDGKMLFRNSKTSFPERLTDESVGVEIDLPVMVVVAARGNGQHRAGAVLRLLPKFKGQSSK